MTSSSNSVESRFVKLDNGLQVHYQEAGNGPTPILFVPGWTMTTEVFCRQLEFFQGSDDFRFITFDPRSHGKTTMSIDGHTYEQHGRDLKEFIHALALENLILCGWSFATLSMLSYVNQFGYEKLSGLIMLDGPPRATGNDPKKDWVTYSYDDADGFQEFCTMAKLRDEKSANIAFADWLLEVRDPNAIEWLVRVTEQTPNEVAALLNATANFFDYREDLMRVAEALPVWCVLREDQRKIVFDWCAQHLKSARLSAFGGHMMFWERSEQFNEELLDFANLVKEPLAVD